MGRVVLLDRDELSAGESCYAQMQLESFVCVLYGDRFVLRSYSPMETIGGGVVLVPMRASISVTKTRLSMNFKT